MSRKSRTLKIVLLIVAPLFFAWVISNVFPAKLQSPSESVITTNTRQQDYSAEIKIKNEGFGFLVIKGVSVSCKCTGVTWPKMIPPFSTASLHLKVRLPQPYKSDQVLLAISSNDAASPVRQLKVKFQGAGLEIDNREINFDIGSKEQLPTSKAYKLLSKSLPEGIEIENGLDAEKYGLQLQLFEQNNQTFLHVGYENKLIRGSFKYPVYLIDKKDRSRVAEVLIYTNMPSESISANQSMIVLAKGRESVQCKFVNIENRDSLNIVNTWIFPYQYQNFFEIHNIGNGKVEARRLPESPYINGGIQLIVETSQGLFTLPMFTAEDFTIK